jgi:hypothetical protein
VFCERSAWCIKVGSIKALILEFES